MSELNQMNCDDFSEAAAELALGVLTGRERAQAIEHASQCDDCREYVRQLTVLDEELLQLLPAAAPPAGFESRVLDRIGPAAPVPAPVIPLSQAGAGRRATRASRHAGWGRRKLAAAAVALAAAGIGAAGWGLGAATSAPAPLASASLVSAGHHAVGTIFLYNGSPRWLYMSVDMESANETVICQLVGRDGRVVTVGSFRVVGGYGYWGSPDPAGVGTVAGARLTGSNGAVLATATFSA